MRRHNSPRFVYGESDPAFVACIRGNTSDLQTCLDSGWDVNHLFTCGDHPLQVAIRNNNFEAVKFLLENGTDKLFVISSLTVACMYPNTDVKTVKLLVAHGAKLNIEKNGSSPLSLAVRLRNPYVVRYLLKNGAKPNSDRLDGESLLMYLLNDYVWCNHIEKANGRLLRMIELFIKNGADVNFISPKTGRTCLMLACSIHCYEIIKLLIEKGANINDLDYRGASALYWAGMDNRWNPKADKNRTACYLISKGAKDNIGLVFSDLIRRSKVYAVLANHVDTTDVLRYIYSFGISV